MPILQNPSGFFTSRVIYKYSHVVNNFYPISVSHYNFCPVVLLSHCYLVILLILEKTAQKQFKCNRDKFLRMEFMISDFLNSFFQTLDFLLSQLYPGHSVIVPERRKTSQVSSAAVPDDSLEIVSGLLGRERESKITQSSLSLEGMSPV